MRGQKLPDKKRWKQCPDCGLFFAPAGLVGHRFYYHQKGIGKKPEQRPEDGFSKAYSLVRQAKRTTLIDRVAEDMKKHGAMSDELMVKLQELMLEDYLFEQGPFAKR